MANSTSNNNSALRAPSSEIQVFVGMSGGVDSSVAAAKLVEQGYDVTGVFMKNWSGDEYGIQEDCPWKQDQEDAAQVCDKLGIPFRSFNFEEEYRRQVVDYFFAEYEKGRTPNPDIMCNKQIKFGLFLKKAQSLGADMIATGHYARVKKQNYFQLLKGEDSQKDQSYFLYTLGQEQLSKTLFPIGHLKKQELRAQARKLGLHNANKPDSQGICFIGEINVLEYLKSKLPIKPGAIVDIDSGKRVGEHDGAYFHTIGQRGGLGIGGQEVPYYVIDRDVTENIVYVGHGHDHPGLMKTKIVLEDLHVISGQEADSLIAKHGLAASIRYRHNPEIGRLTTDNGVLTFEFDKPQWAPAAGQSLVIYDGDECMGGGVILETGN